jgi:hypothetical protein
LSRNSLLEIVQWRREGGWYEPLPPNPAIELPARNEKSARLEKLLNRKPHRTFFK